MINSSKEQLVASATAATASVLAATKSPQRDEGGVAGAGASTGGASGSLQGDRRKSMSWKTFNLKRQLSKVNMKIGGSLNVNSELESIRSNSSSIFYAPKETSPESGPGDEPALPPCPPAEALECREEDVDLATATAMLNCDTETPTAAPAPTQKRVDFEQRASPESGERPNNLPLSEQQQQLQLQQQQQQQQVPLKPTRQKFKEKARDQRLLSVPNIKYQPREQRAGGIGIGINKNDVSPMMSGSLTKKIRKYG